MKKALLISLLLHGGIGWKVFDSALMLKKRSLRTLDILLVEKKVSSSIRKISEQPPSPEGKLSQSLLPPRSDAKQEMSNLDSQVSNVELSEGPFEGDYRPAPTYPAEALENEREGEVLLEIETNAEGRVVAVVLKKSSGTQILDEEAFKTVKQWRLTPSIKVIVPILFQITPIGVSEAPN